VIPFYSICDLLENGDTQLGKLIAKVRDIEALHHTLQKILDPTLAPHCHIGHYQSGILTIFSENAAWATQLRYQVPEIITKLRSFPEWAGLCSIQIKVQTEGYQKITEPAPASPPPTLSEHSASQLQALADQLKQQVETEHLAASVENLVKQTRQRGSYDN